eukprot:227848_1
MAEDLQIVPHVPTDSSRGTVGLHQLHILPKKSWHVWNEDNLSRVERDEREHAEKERAREANEKSARQEVRLGELRQRCRGARDGRREKKVARIKGVKEEKKERNDSRALTLPSSEPGTRIVEQSGHINFFINSKREGGNKEYEAEQKAEKQKVEEKFLPTIYLGATQLKSSPWYAESRTKLSSADANPTIALHSVRNPARLTRARHTRLVDADPMNEVWEHFGEKEDRDGVMDPKLARRMRQQKRRSEQIQRLQAIRDGSWKKPSKPSASKNPETQSSPQKLIAAPPKKVSSKRTYASSSDDFESSWTSGGDDSESTHRKRRRIKSEKRKRKNSKKQKTIPVIANQLQLSSSNTISALPKKVQSKDIYSTSVDDFESSRPSCEGDFESSHRKRRRRKSENPKPESLKEPKSISTISSSESNQSSSSSDSDSKQRKRRRKNSERWGNKRKNKKRKEKEKSKKKRRKHKKETRKKK